MQEFFYKEDIVATRKGGFGSSDAEIILKLANGAELCKTDRDRIAEMLGMKEHKDFTNWRIERGNEYEQYAYEAMLMAFPNAVSNPYYASEERSAKYGFNVFNHIDMEVESADSLTWYEMKTSSKTIEEVLEHYRPQLAWHWMLLREKAEKLGKVPQLTLLYHPLEMDFDMDNLMLVPVASIDNPFEKGFERMKELLKDFEWSEEPVNPMELMPTDMQEGLRILDAKVAELKELEEYVKNERKSLVANMELYCVPNGITTIPMEHYKIVYVSGSSKPVENVDMDALLASHPELREKYTKTVTTEVVDLEKLKEENRELVNEFTTITIDTRKSSVQIR